jgi:CBS domain-containing protein
MFRLLGIETDEDIIDAVRSNGAEVLGDDLIHESRPSVLAAMDVGYSREAAMKHASFILKSKTPLLDRVEPYPA